LNFVPDFILLTHMRYLFRVRLVALLLLSLVAFWQTAGIVHAFAHHDCTEVTDSDDHGVTFSAPECELCDVIDHQVYYLPDSHNPQIARVSVPLALYYSYLLYPDHIGLHYLRGPPHTA